MTTWPTAPVTRTPSTYIDALLLQSNAAANAQPYVAGRKGLTRHKVSDRRRERAWLQAGRADYIKARHRSCQRFADNRQCYCSLKTSTNPTPVPPLFPLT